MPEVTLLEIARRLGVSKTAVSLALRGKPGLSQETNQRIIDLARELGYSPNPVSAELMAMVRAKRPPSGAQTIAFFNTLKDPSQMRLLFGFWEFVVGAEERARHYGYRVEVFETQSPGMTVDRMAGILSARGIRGILVGPSWATDPPLGFPWERFSAVVLGDPERGDHLHRVCHHHIHGCVTALEVLAAKGYRNILVTLGRRNQRNTGFAYMLGVEQFRQRTTSGVNVTTWIYDEWVDAERREGIEKGGFDAVVALDPSVGRSMETIRDSADRPLAFASLNRPPDSRKSGINQHTEAIGAAAVDLLRGLLLSGERGVASRPQILLVDGEWVEGETTPGPTQEAEVMAVPARAARRRKVPSAA